MARTATDRRDLKLDRTTWDLAVENRDFAFVAGNNAIAQLIRFKLQLFQGEWFFDPEAGTPWFQDILGTKYDETFMRNIFFGLVMGVEGVVEIVSLSLTFDNAKREMFVAYEVRTEFDGTVSDSFTVGQVAA